MRHSLFVALAVVLAVMVGVGACSSSSSGPGPDAGCTSADASVTSYLSLDAGPAACQSCIRSACSASIETCSTDCNCNTSAVSALRCIEGVSSVASVASCVSDLTGASDNALVQVGTCLAGCAASCGAGAADAASCAMVDATVTAYLDAGIGAGACSTCLQVQCGASVQACAEDCQCNATTVGVLQCLGGLGSNASIASTTACVAPVEGSGSDPKVLAVGSCLVSACAGACGLQSEAGATEAGDAGCSGSGVATAVSTGFAASCAVLSTGGVECWGRNNKGQLGNGSTNNSPAPLPVSNINNAVAVGNGNEFACALLADGTVDCWGYGATGVLGTGSTTTGATGSLTPVAVPGVSSATALAVGGGVVCVLLEAGTVQCWGDDVYGEIGAGGPESAVPSLPVVVPNLTGVKAIAAGNVFVCALLSAGTVQCWGDDSYGELGYIATSQLFSSTPVAVPGVTGATAISTGLYAACVLLSDGSVRCWGENVMGQVGNGADGSVVGTPVPVSGLSDVVGLAAGGNYSCAVSANGTVECWGDMYAASGTILYTYSANPTSIVVSNVTSLAAGLFAACALQSNGAVVCWGDNTYGELGDGSTVSSPSAVQVTGIGGCSGP